MQQVNKYNLLSGDQVAYEDATPVTFHFEGDKGLRKTKYRVPHDLGNPGMGLLVSTGTAHLDVATPLYFAVCFSMTILVTVCLNYFSAQDPFLIINCYEMHNTARWRDLNLKFILQSYRDYLILDKDEAFLKHVWNAITVWN